MQHILAANRAFIRPCVPMGLTFKGQSQALRMDPRASGGVHIAYHHLTSRVCTYLLCEQTNRPLSASSVCPTGIAPDRTQRFLKTPGFSCTSCGVDPLALCVILTM